MYFEEKKVFERKKLWSDWRETIFMKCYSNFCDAWFFSMNGERENTGHIIIKL